MVGVRSPPGRVSLVCSGSVLSGTLPCGPGAPKPGLLLDAAGRWLPQQVPEHLPGQPAPATWGLCLCLLGCGTAHWPSLSAQIPSGQPRAQCWGSSLEASEPSFPVTQPSPPGVRTRVWPRTACLRLGQNPWPGLLSAPKQGSLAQRHSVPRAGGGVGGLPPFSPAALLPPAGHPHAPRSLPLPAQAPFHRALVLACF